MIKVNLLPYREEIKKRLAIRQLFLAALLIIVFVVGLGLWQAKISSKVKSLELQIDEEKKKIARLNRKTAGIYAFQQKQAEYQKKLDKIEELNKGRKFPVHIMDEIAKAVPDKLWLERYVNEDSKLSLLGIALDNETIAVFMRNLEKSGYFENIRLLWTKKYVKYDLNLKKFNIDCSTRRPPGS